MSIDCPLSLYDVTVTNMATVRSVQIAAIGKMMSTESVLVFVREYKYDYNINSTVESI